MKHPIDSKQLYEIFTKHFPLMCFMLFLSIIMCSPDRNYWQIYNGLVFMNFWTYFAHRCIHDVPKDGFLGQFNTHWLFHHQNTKLLPRPVELLLEFFTDISMNISLIVLQYISGIWFVPLSVILLFTIQYTSVHIINYSIVGSDSHRKHHKNIDTNFGPDTMDHFFGTNDDDTFEDLNPFFINTIAAFGITSLAKYYFKWED
jgi:hypothetical protein